MAIIYTNTSSGSLRRNRKKAKNLSASQIEKYKEDLRLHNKFMKQKHLHDMVMNLEDYIKYRHGILKTKLKEREFVPLKSVPSVRETKNYPSLSESKTPYMGNGATIDHKQRQERIEVSKGYTIVPAYNKGPYMVISKSEIKTAGKKV